MLIIGKNGVGKVYFNARFDDVMLIVKHEMASALGGLFPTTVWIYILVISSNLSFREKIQEYFSLVRKSLVTYVLYFYVKWLGCISVRGKDCEVGFANTS